MVEKELTSYMDREKSEFMEWEKLWIESVKKVQEAYSTVDIAAFRRAVRNLYFSLCGHIDLDYMVEDLKLTQLQLDEYEFLSQRTEQLMRLLARITQGETKIIESVDDSAIIEHVARELSAGIGQNLIITGTPGSGKSWSTGSLAEQVTEMTGQKFDPKVHVVFTNKQFFDLYNNPDLVPKGSAIIFEEVTLSGKMNSKRGMSNVNMILGDIMQTARRKGLFILFNAPDLGGLDKPQRKLLHFWLKTEKLDKKGGNCWVTPHVINVNQRSGEIYYQYPRFDRSEAVVKLRITKPSKNFIDVYEPRQKEYKDQLDKESAAKVAELDGSSNELTDEERIYVDARLAGVSQKEARTGVNRSTAWSVRVDMKAKKLGYKIPDLRRGAAAVSRALNSRKSATLRASN